MKHILVALDGSPRASGILDTAIDVARKTGAKLTLFRGVGIPPEIPSEAMIGAAASLEDILRKSAEQYLDGVAKTVPAELFFGPERTVVGLGSPWEAVCHAAETRHVDLIVIGSHGYRGLDRVLGTTAAKIVNHATCSVLVVRPPKA